MNLRVDIDCVAQGLEGKGSLFVGKDEKQPKQFPVDADQMRPVVETTAGRKA